MLNLAYGVFNVVSGGGFTPAYYTPTSSAGGWANPENAYDGTGVATGVQSTLDMSSCLPGAFLSSESSVDETYSFVSLTGFSQIVIAGSYGYELTSAATQFTTGSLEIPNTGYVTGIARFRVEVSTNGGGAWSTIEQINCNTLPPGISPTGQTITGSGTFGATIYSGGPIALPVNLNSLQIRLSSYVTANARRAEDEGGTPNTLYVASGLAENNVSNMTVYVS